MYLPRTLLTPPASANAKTSGCRCAGVETSTTSQRSSCPTVTPRSPRRVDCFCVNGLRPVRLAQASEQDLYEPWAPTCHGEWGIHRSNTPELGRSAQDRPTRGSSHGLPARPSARPARGWPLRGVEARHDPPSPSRHPTARPPVGREPCWGVLTARVPGAHGAPEPWA
jgi:hypothetical protein